MFRCAMFYRDFLNIQAVLFGVELFSENTESKRASVKEGKE